MSVLVRQFRRLWFAGLLAMAWPFVANASGADPATLAKLPRWQALMHVNHGATWRDVGESYVDDDAFFLSPQGKRSPLAELKASIRAMREPGSPARCRFPARFRFIAEQLGWPDAGRGLAHCADYLQFRSELATGQLVLIFPTAYLNSPSSMFGHTLLRLDPEPDPDSTWLSHAINFGANINLQDNSLQYMWRGLAGGYPGQFSIVPYAEKIQEYSRVENRDIWEYPLNLTPDELDWLARHLWALRDINFDYYFLDENCSFRLLELIDVARPEANLLRGWRFAEVPVKTVRALYRAGLVADARFRPSKATELARLSESLSSSERSLARQLLRDPSLAGQPAFQTLAPARQHRVARTAYQALRMDHREGERDTDVATRSLALLRLMQQTPAGAMAQSPPPAPPEAGHDTQTLTMAAGVAHGAAYGEFGYRLSYHDPLDRARGFLPGTGIQGLDLRLRWADGESLALERLHAVNIRSLTPWTTFDRPISWFVAGGLEQRLVDTNDDELMPLLEGGPGASWRWGSLVPYVFGVARLENPSTSRAQFDVGAGAEAGALFYGAGLQVGLTTRWLEFDGGRQRRRSSLTANLPLSRNTALRAACSHERTGGEQANDCSLSLRFFLD